MPQYSQFETHTEFYTEDLIKLVKERTALWNQNAEEYRDKNLKTAAWDEICSTLNDGYQELDKRAKADYRRSVVCKWTNVRDCWKKCMNKRNEHRPGRKPPRPYIYHRQLSFLLENDTNIISAEKLEGDFYNENSETGFGTGEDGEGNSSPREIPLTFKEEPISPYSGGRKRKVEEQDSAQATAFDNNHTNQKEEENRHMLFFQSLLPSLAALDDDQTIRFQIEVLTLLHKFRKQRRSVSND